MKSRKLATAAALGAVARALPLSPDDTTIEARLARLAEATSAWAAAAEALGLAVEACSETHTARAAELHFHRGAVLEERLADPAGAPFGLMEWTDGDSKVEPK